MALACFWLLHGSSAGVCCWLWSACFLELSMACCLLGQLGWARATSATAASLSVSQPCLPTSLRQLLCCHANLNKSISCPSCLQAAHQAPDAKGWALLPPSTTSTA
eukprot:scaffold2592_cov16-Tisochrysis_lutea.AAC.4